MAYPLGLARKKGKKEEDKMDARLSFLARAAARWWLVDRGEMELDEAFSGLVDDITERRAIEKHFTELWVKDRRNKLNRWRASGGPNHMHRMRSPEVNNSNKEE